MAFLIILLCLKILYLLSFIIASLSMQLGNFKISLIRMQRTVGCYFLNFILGVMTTVLTTLPITTILQGGCDNVCITTSNDI